LYCEAVYIVVVEKGLRFVTVGGLGDLLLCVVLPVAGRLAGWTPIKTVEKSLICPKAGRTLVKVDRSGRERLRAGLAAIAVAMNLFEIIDIWVKLVV
jgi:hypothetical protein